MRSDSAAPHSRLLCLVLALACSGCFGAPVAIKRLSPRDASRAQAASILTTDELSRETEVVLRRHNLQALYAADPRAAIQRLHVQVADDSDDNAGLIALAEMSLKVGEDEEARDYALAAAVYAYAYLFPNEAAPPWAKSMDPDVPLAADLYRRALVAAFRSDDGRRVVFRAGAYPLPFGSLAVRFDEQHLLWGDLRLVDLEPAAEIEVVGMKNRYRQPGLGAALTASTEPAAGDPGDRLTGKALHVAVTAILRLDQARQQLRGDQLTGLLEIYPTNDVRTAVVSGVPVPLEAEPTVALASSVVQSHLWDTELSAFLGNLLNVREPSRLGAIEPFHRGRIPVVFVHGTASSPMRWADMVNDLQADPVLRDRFQFWFFTYDSGNPIAYSSMLLRQALSEAVARLDAQGIDPCLQNMVVIGHSQGGLLTKMTAVDTSDQLWANVSSKPFDQAKLSEASRTLLKDALFVEPLPFVKRVIFVATPHGGSYLAGPQFVSRLAAWMISMPKNLVGVTADVVGLSDATSGYMQLQRIPTSIDNMSPGNGFIKTLRRIPVAPGIAAHSIVGVDGGGPVASGGDGVVKYESAHIAGVESEFVVDSPHSMQSHPDVVNEVDRILRLHAAAHPDCAP